MCLFKTDTRAAHASERRSSSTVRASPRRNHTSGEHSGARGTSDKSDSAADDGVMKDCVFFSSTAGAVRARRD